MTGPGGVACGFLIDQQLQESSLGLPSVPVIARLAISLVYNPKWNSENRSKGQGSLGPGCGQSSREAACCAAHSHPVRSHGSGLVMREDFMDLTSQESSHD